LHAVETVAGGDIYVSPLIASLAIEKFARGRHLLKGLDLLSDRELTIFSLIAAGQGVGRIARGLGISRKTVETHSQHIKLKLGYANAEALRRGAHELLGVTQP
jgi:DNA-binding NarL/FixJ family response regulator